MNLQQDISWAKAHLLSLALIGALAYGGIYTVESLNARHDAANASKYAAILATQTQTVEEMKTRLSESEQRSAVIEQTLLAQNASLAKTLEQQNQQTQKQVQNDQSLDAQGAATRLSTQTGASTGEVTVSGANVVLDLPVTRRVVADLDTLVGTQADLKTTQAQLANESQIAGTAQADAQAQKALVVAQQNQLADAQKACSAQIASIKADARRGKLKAFLFGALTILAGVAGHAI